MMKAITRIFPGVLFCVVLAIGAWHAGRVFNIIGGPVFAILIGMVLSGLIKNKEVLQAGVGFASKKVLQYAVILLGFGMNLSVVMETGKRSLPIILSTILSSLAVAYILQRVLHVQKKQRFWWGLAPPSVADRRLRQPRRLLKQAMMRWRSRSL